MMKQNKQILLRVSLVILMVTVIHTYSFGLFGPNYGDETYAAPDGNTAHSEGGNTGTAAGESPSKIKIYIIEGAAYFLKSHSAMLKVLNLIERSELEGLDYTTLQTELNKTIENMELAKLYYSLLKSTAERTPYNTVKIQQLQSFDYETFQKEKGLNATTFRQVRNYLGKGDVTGFFGDLISRTETILEKLYKIQKTTVENQFPLVQGLWDLNRDYAEFLMAGQYSAQVFYEIKIAAN